MQHLETALIRLTVWLEQRNVPYMVIGGFAVMVWGEPRLTQDLDVTIWVTADRMDQTVRDLTQEFPTEVSDPIAFIQSVRVLPVTVGAIRADVIFANLPYEEQAIKRALRIELPSGGVFVCAPEDLILHKIISTRAKDRQDIEGIFKTRHASLDYSYLDPRVRELSDMLADPAIFDWYDSLRIRWP